MKMTSFRYKMNYLSKTMLRNTKILDESSDFICWKFVPFVMGIQLETRKLEAKNTILKKTF